MESRPLRVPFGAKNAPVWFHNAVSRMFEGIPNLESIFDDVAIGAKSTDELLATLKLFYTRCRENHVGLKAIKCLIGPEKLPYVGRLISSDKVEVDPSRLQPFLNAIAPYDKATLRSYLGSINWFIPFVPGLGVFAGSLYELMSKDTPFKWTTQHQQLFELIKNRISNP